MARGIAIKLVLPYDVSQEQYLLDQDGFMKKAQKKTLVQQPGRHYNLNQLHLV